MNELIEELVDFLIERKLTIRATSRASLLITDQETGEEYLVDDLGYPF